MPQVNRFQTALQTRIDLFFERFLFRIEESVIYSQSILTVTLAVTFIAIILG